MGEALQRCRKTIAVDDLTVTDEPVLQLAACAAHDTTGVDLGGGEVAAVDVETDGAAF